MDLLTICVARPAVSNNLAKSPMDALITPAEAETRLLAALTPLGSERVEATEAMGRTLAEPLLADRPLPPFDRVMMDGIAFRAADARHAHGQLAIAGLHPAGAPAPSRKSILQIHHQSAYPIPYIYIYIYI